MQTSSPAISPEAAAAAPAGEPISISRSMEYAQPFGDLKNLQPTTLEAIQSTFGYEAMSKVQVQVLSQLPTQHDLMVKAKTGTGKTLAFLVAALESLMALPLESQVKMTGKIGCVIITPTRELSLQISEEATRLLKPLGWGVQYLVGGESKGKQLDRISKEPAEFVVATPGRMKDLLGNTEFAAKIQESKVLILDEADTILQLGFRTELDTILETMPKDRQTFLFSATVDSKVDALQDVALHKDKTHKPIMIDTVGNKEVNLNLATQQRYTLAPYQSHVALVRRIINDHLLSHDEFEYRETPKQPAAATHRMKSTTLAKTTTKDTSSTVPKTRQNNKIMVFLPTTRGAQLYAKVFATLSMGKELSVFEIHSAKQQRERTLTSRNFKTIRTPAVLFTSDVSARGVDYPGVGLVVQVGAPLSLEHYIHRIGRTGRGDVKKAGITKGLQHDEEDHEGKGILVLGELDEGFIEHQLKPSPLYNVVKQEHKYDDWKSVVLGESLDRGFKRALSKVDEKLAKSAYTAFLGYNLTVGPRIGSTDRKKILQSADKYIEGFGVEERPAISAGFLGRMGFMKYRTGLEEDDGQLLDGEEALSMELVDGTFPAINARITKTSLLSPSTRDDKEEVEGESMKPVMNNYERTMSRKQKRMAFEARTDVPETEYIQINEDEWEDFIEFKPGMPKLIEKLHSPKRLGHFGDRPSKKISKIFKFQKVTCGSSIKLTHEKTGFKLHSHQIPYGTGSGQQSITAVPSKEDTNSLWIVMAQLGHTCERGEPVPCGSVIRLKHVNTKKFLHSHHHQSPMSGGLEVSAYDGLDSGDNWTLNCLNNNKDAFWIREQPVHLVHLDTGKYLATSARHVYSNPIPGQQEVAAHSSHTAGENKWMAQEGVYFAEKEDVKEEL
ncbi:hypothetical protein BG004_001991 [Podila humilis]|nr:hypothetical protein BG004_001991 [Podila humilis]